MPPDVEELRLQDFRNLKKYYKFQNAQGSFRDFAVEQLTIYPFEVSCETCGSSYVIDEPCFYEDDDLMTNTWHVTIQQPLRPWNQLLDKI